MPSQNVTVHALCHENRKLSNWKAIYVASEGMLLAFSLLETQGYITDEIIPALEAYTCQIYQP